MWWMSVVSDSGSAQLTHMHIHNAAYINGTGVGRGAAVPEYRLPPYGTVPYILDLLDCHGDADRRWNYVSFRKPARQIRI